MKMNAKNLDYAPVVLFVYNRKDHTKQTIEALQRNELALNTDLFIFSDAPKAETDYIKVKEVRDYINSVDENNFNKVKIVEQTMNKGLAESIIDGVTSIVEEYGKVIVLEDDLVTCPFFLSYMNDGLRKYKNSTKVYSICGYSFFTEYGWWFDKLSLPMFYFLDYFCSWGWATWKEKWKHFDREAVGWEKLTDDSKMSYRFSFEGTRPDTKLLLQQMNYGIDSWALRWRWSIFINDGIALFPNRTMVRNIGWDGTGTHGAGGDPTRSIKLCKKYVDRFPIKIKEKKWIRKRLVNIWKPSIIRRIINKMKRIINSIHGKRMI